MTSNNNSSLLSRSVLLLNNIETFERLKKTEIPTLPSTFSPQQLGQVFYKLNKNNETEWNQLADISLQYNSQLDEFDKSNHSENKSFSTEAKELECLQFEYIKLKKLEQTINTEFSNYQFMDNDTTLPIKLKQTLLNDAHLCQVSTSQVIKNIKQTEEEAINLQNKIDRANSLIDILDKLIKQEMIEKPKQTLIEQNEKIIQKLNAKTKGLSTSLNSVLSQCIEINPPQSIKYRLNPQSIPTVSFKNFVENLLNKSVSTQDPYIKLPDTDTIEFKHYYYPMITLLFKAKLIHYHPKDSSKIRLIDFTS